VNIARFGRRKQEGIKNDKGRNNFFKRKD